MKVIPLQNRVIVQRDEVKKKTPGGLYLPDSAEKERPQRGKVTAIGEGKLMDDGTIRKCLVKEGDVVLFSTYAGNSVKELGEDTIIMSDEDILAIVVSYPKESVS